MTATAVDRRTTERVAMDFEFPVAASTKMLTGTIACVNASGLATPGATSTTLKAVGVVSATADNTEGAASAIRVSVRRGCFQFANSASADLITLADINADCYIVDNQTVAKTNGSNTRSVAGKVMDVDTKGVWVKF